MQKQWQLTIENYNSEGQGVARWENQVIFVPGALKGETVWAELSSRKKNYCLAKLTAIQKASPHRVSPPCPYFARCGGCQLQHMAYEEQLAFKTQKVAASLRRLGNLKEFTVCNCLPSVSVWKYRERANFHVQEENGILKAGFYQKKSRQLVPIDECLLLPENFIAITQKVMADLNYYGIKGMTELWLRQGNVERTVMLILHSAYKKVDLTPCFADWVQAFPFLQSIVIINKDGQEEVLYGCGSIQQNLLQCSFSFYPQSFAQVNAQQTEVLYDCVQKMTPAISGQLLDVYCGVGTIGQIVAKEQTKVSLIGIEENEASIQAAQENAVANQIKAQYFAGAAEQLLPRLMAENKLSPHCIILDPPRTGCKREALDCILQLNAPSIIYVSCQPATLARDLAIITAAGYQIKKVQPIDMFPQTEHVETVVLMSKVSK